MMARSLSDDCVWLKIFYADRALLLVLLEFSLLKLLLDEDFG